MVRQEAWGNYITLQAIVDMLCVKINVLCSNHPMFSVTPAGICSAKCEIFVGLIFQYHYVGLDKLPAFDASVDNIQNSPNSSSEADDTIDDAIVEERDEHRISGASMASMMCVKNPESYKDIIFVAPAEREKPLNTMTDSNFVAMSNPDKFPCGKVHLAVNGLRS